MREHELKHFEDILKERRKKKKKRNNQFRTNNQSV